MENIMIQFPAEDGVNLNGYIHRKQKDNNKILIQIHGMTSNCFKKREAFIANKLDEINVDSMCFNTRGSEIVKYIKDKNGNKKLAGTAYEDIEESYYDLLGAIKYAIKLGYTNIYLQGHSLGATKVVYFYSKMQKENNEYLKFVKAIILLSLVDIPDMIKTYSNIENIEFARTKNANGENMDLMPRESFIHPISIKTFLSYLDVKDIDFAQYDNNGYEFEVLNNIDVPIFMRWGNINELIKKTATEQVELMNKKIRKSEKDINYIDGANHSYDGKEDILANEICTFLTENVNI